MIVNGVKDACNSILTQLDKIQNNLIKQQTDQSINQVTNEDVIAEAIQTATNKSIHCDDCGEYPLIGTRFICIDCNTVLCNMCENQTPHPPINHILLKIPGSHSVSQC